MWIIATQTAVVLHKSVHGFKFIQKHVYRRTSDVGVGRAVRCFCGGGGFFSDGEPRPSAGWEPAAGTVWKKTVMSGRKGKIILEICIDMCYTDSVPVAAGTDETLPAPRGSVSADKFVRKVSNWKTIPSIS